MATATPIRSRIFINYRREDTAWVAGRLADDLRRHFASDQVFQDFASIEPGTDFTVAVQHGLDACAAVLVIIGPRWLTIADHRGRRRLDLPDDWVTHEIAESLKRPEVRVFPLLVDADMPSGEELPEPLRPLTRRQAFPLTSRHWSNDVGDLIAHLKKVPGLSGAEPPAAGTSEAPPSDRVPKSAPQAAPPRRPPPETHPPPRGPEQKASVQAVSAPTTTAGSTAVVSPRRVEGAERGRAEAEAQRQAEQAAQLRLAEAEAQRQAEQAAQRRLAEAEARRQAEEADQRRLAEVEARRQAEQAEQPRLAEAEAQRQAESASTTAPSTSVVLPLSVETATPVQSQSPRTRRRATASGSAREPGARDGFEALLRQHERDPAARAAAVEPFVAKEGDRRFRPDAWFLPDDPMLGFIEIPAGPFMMGSDRKLDRWAFDDEIPAHQVTLPALYMARFPSTVAQFRAYVEDAGVTPGDPDCLRGPANHPVANVSWHEALAYCEWLTRRLAGWSGAPDTLARVLALAQKGRKPWRVTLASEAEWEKAARGADRRLYPWEGPADPDKANYSDTAIGGTSAVGCFPGGASPYGVEDMSGNVWEWTRSLWGSNPEQPTFKYPYRSDDGREDLAAGAAFLRVVRGGAFYSPDRGVRAAARNAAGPDGPAADLGFRVVVSPFFSDR